MTPYGREVAIRWLHLRHVSAALLIVPSLPWTYSWNESAAKRSKDTDSILALSCLSIRICLAITSFTVRCSPKARAACVRGKVLADMTCSNSFNSRSMTHNRTMFCGTLVPLVSPCYKAYISCHHASTLLLSKRCRHLRDPGRTVKRYTWARFEGSKRCNNNAYER